ncbi:EF-hand domain-containing protein [Psychromonas sp. L1A2]|uniref:EF-hand domain-containing protein n=1 Tax=Psychromonas sp. L1A2 TaxID=2686356 RepID=UPI001358CA13|nr:EF-hand domain-containing protein [Psychromonas sp. L1A2]
MKKLFILSGVALMVSSSLTMAAGNNSAKYDFGKFDLNKDGQISVVEATGKLAKHFDKIDADSNDLISEAEFAEMKKMRESKKPTFADFDTNNDGSISSAEFDAAKKMKKGKGHHKVDFAKVDVNKDGQITKDEAKRGLLKRFDKIDSDANGSISTTEFAALEKMHKGKGNHKLDFGSIDTNNDSKITKDEAKGRLAKHFDKVDADANGLISTAEFAALEKMHKGKGNHKLDFAAIDTNNDSQITKDEAKGRLSKHFDKIDSDKNGVITQAELSEMQKMHKGKGHKKGNKEVSFAKLDVNSDGVITKDETKGRLAKHFDKVDTDANGSITSAEFELVKNMKKGKHGQKVSFSTLDVNKDGAITKDEAKGRLLNNFDKIDGDADGKITTQELDAKRGDRKGNKRPTFEMLDADGNGKVSNAEFTAFQQKHAEMKK